jgi:hypothetical protein
MYCIQDEDNKAVFLNNMYCIQDEDSKTVFLNNRYQDCEPHHRTRLHHDHILRHTILLACGLFWASERVTGRFQRLGISRAER